MRRRIALWTWSNPADTDPEPPQHGSEELHLSTGRELEVARAAMALAPGELPTRGPTSSRSTASPR